MGESGQTRGFTLIEILVAVTAFSILILMVFSSFQSFISSSRTIKDQVTVDAMIQPCLAQMTRDFEQIYILRPPRYQPPAMGSPPDPYRLVGGETLSEVQGFSRIEFSSLNHARIGSDQRRGVARIAYYVRPDSQQGYELCRSDQLESADQEIKQCNDPVLLRHVTGFDVRFKDASEKDESENEYPQWDSESDQFGYAFPSTIDIELTFLQDASTHIIKHRIRIPVHREVME